MEPKKQKVMNELNEISVCFSMHGNGKRAYILYDETPGMFFVFGVEDAGGEPPEVNVALDLSFAKELAEEFIDK